MPRSRRLVALLLGVFLTAGSLSACLSRPQATVVAFLLAGASSSRWTESDEPSFRDRVELACPGCEYVTRSADHDADVQARQFASVLAEGADVIVLNAVTADGGEELVASAGDVPVVAYDRFVPGADFFVSYDAAAIGSQLAGAVADRIGREGRVLLLNGPQTDSNGVAVKKAVHAVFRRTGVVILAERDPAGRSAEEARSWAAQQLARHPVATIDAIVSAYDTQAAGVAQALTAAKTPLRSWPLVTGQDADLQALRRIVTGQQTLTVYKSFPREAQQAADLAVTLATGGKVDGGANDEGVTSFVFEPQVVTIDNLTDTVVRDGVYSTAQICIAAILPRCEELGLR